MKIYALHGFLGLPEDWDSLKLPNLYAVNLSDPQFPSPKEGLWAWAETFNAFVRSQPPEDRVLMGYSLGGRLAMHAAILDPTLWKKAFFISTHPGLKTPQEKAERLIQDTAWANRFLTLPWNVVIEAWHAQPVFTSTYHPYRPEKLFDKQWLASSLTDWGLAHQEDFSKRIPPNAEWIVGEYDTKFHALAPIKPTIIPGAGHRVLFDNPDSLRELFLQF